MKEYSQKAIILKSIRRDVVFSITLLNLCSNFLKDGVQFLINLYALLSCF